MAKIIEFIIWTEDWFIFVHNWNIIIQSLLVTCKGCEYTHTYSFSNSLTTYNCTTEQFSKRESSSWISSLSTVHLSACCVAADLFVYRGRGRAFPQQRLASLPLPSAPPSLSASLPLALPRLEATQPPLSPPPASPLTAHCCCTCSKCTHQFFNTCWKWKHTAHAIAKVKRNPPYNYRHICKYANSHHSLHKRANVFSRSFWPGKRSIKSPNTSFVYILLTPHLKSNVNHSLSQIPKHKYVKRRKILNQFVKKFLWFFFISATTRIAVTTLMGWVGPFKASLFPFHLSLIVQLFRTRILIACCLQGSQRENRYVQYSSSGARFVNVDRHQTRKN